MPFIFAKHNFVEDFLHATGTGDKFLIQEMINDQLAKLIIEHKPKVIKALRDNGIAVKSDAKNQTIADCIIANVDYNKPLAIELKNLIVKYNIPQKEFKFSADGVITNLLKDEKVQNAMKEGLVQGIQNVGKKKTDTKNNENAYALKERIRLAEMQNSMLKIEGNKMETKTKIIIGVGVTVVVIVATILIMKSMKNKNATGGQLGSNANAGAGAVANPPLAK